MTIMFPHPEAVPSLVKQPVDGAENQARFDGDEHSIVAVAHPYLAVRRVDQAELPVVVHPILTAPEQ
jgi:hypothetical protein